ncbi:hypothetical protein CPC08DRAFT_666234 [Agrocybe pediades]|nr:hypothetical protein CPC08DRAFT_666234 [Agrocybe pediades]
MSFKTTQENLRTFFKSAGEITRINMQTKAPTGPGVPPEMALKIVGTFAYVDFATPEAKAAAIALSEQPLIGRKLLIKDGDSFEGRPSAIAGEHAITDPSLAHKTHSKTAQKILRAQKQPPAPTLFFGNLGFETTEESIRELLEAHRPKPKKGKEVATDGDEPEQKSKGIWIRKVRMGTFEDSGLCKGFAFVDFMTVEHATSALINPKNHHLNGRKLVVEYASADAVRRGAPKSSRPADGTAGRGRGGGRGRGRGGGGGTGRNFDRPPRNFDFPTDEGHDAHQNAEVPPTNDDTPQPDRSERKDSRSGKEGVRHKGPKNRPKPGAALALAKRESAAIVPAQGQKITF